MREVKNLAAGMKDAVASLRKLSADAKSNLDVEISRANVNAGKVNSLAKELKEANLEIEEFLGETGSNFPSSEESDTQPPDAAGHADKNGVTLNKEA